MAAADRAEARRVAAVKAEQAASRNISRAKKLVDSLDPSNPTSSGPGSNV